MAPLTNAFVAAQNHLLKRSPWALERLRGFSGKQVSIKTGTFMVQFSIDESGYFQPVDGSRDNDVSIELPLAELPALASPGKDGLKANMQLKGNAELAETLGFVFRNLRWDFEEDAAKYLGDIAAHRLGLSLRAFLRAQNRVIEGFRHNTVEYLTEEARVLVPRCESAGLMPNLMTLRDDIARCEKRIEKLKKTITRFCT